MSAEQFDELRLLHATSAFGSSIDAHILEDLLNLLHGPALVVFGMALLRLLLFDLFPAKHILAQPTLSVQSRLRTAEQSWLSQKQHIPNPTQGGT